MSWPNICNITLQDCITRYLGNGYEDGSCVLDTCRGEQLGSCGWVGAKCTILNGTFGDSDNCYDELRAVDL
jgi:hypothetical protein